MTILDQIIMIQQMLEVARDNQDDPEVDQVGYLDQIINYVEDLSFRVSEEILT